jgi:hypothetical protein
VPPGRWQDSKPTSFGSIKTTIEIPEATLEAAMKFTGAKTKRKAFVGAVERW